MTTSSQRPDAVFWDMGGTLIDSAGAWDRACADLLARFGYQWQAKDSTRCADLPKKQLGLFLSSLTNYAYSAHYLIDELILLGRYNLQERLVFKPGTLELIKELHALNIPMALVSNSPREVVDDVMTSIKPYFALSLANDDVANGKPNPEGYLKAAQELKVDITRCLVIEDTFRGVTAGLAAGASVLGVAKHMGSPGSGRFKVLETLDGLTAPTLLRQYLTA